MAWLKPREAQEIGRSWDVSQSQLASRLTVAGESGTSHHYQLGGIQMARKSNMQALLDAAIADASSTILKNAISSMGGNATVLELVTAMKGTSFEAAFHAMTLAELGGAIDSGGEAAPRRGRRPGRPAKAKAAPRKKAARKTSGRLNTHTMEGRAELDAMIGALLQTAPEGLRSEAINAQVPADTHQIRMSLKRMIAAGQVSTTGQRRATTYIWGGGSGATKPARRRRTAKKKTTTKKAAKNRPARKTGRKKATTKKKRTSKKALSKKTSTKKPATAVPALS
ncbi:MAG: hypothetical protein H6716_29125 [Polyangiaceae bacterium]|nr:hypothetical protein [Polyangiaceae bacterium]